MFKKIVLLFFKYLFLVVLLHANLVHAKYPNLFADQSRLARSTCLLYLSSNVDIFEEVDWSAHHVFFQRRFANRYVWVYSRLSHTTCSWGISTVIMSVTKCPRSPCSRIFFTSTIGALPFAALAILSAGDVFLQTVNTEEHVTVPSLVARFVRIALL